MKGHKLIIIAARRSLDTLQTVEQGGNKRPKYDHITMRLLD